MTEPVWLRKELGILLLAVGLYLLITGIIGAWQIRQEVTRRRASENATGRNIARTDIIWYKASNMLTIRGVYDGKTIRPLPGERLPDVKGEVPVQIIFQLEEPLQRGCFTSEGHIPLYPS